MIGRFLDSSQNAKTYSFRDKGFGESSKYHDRSSGDKDDNMRKQWKSGYTLVNDKDRSNSRRLRNDPWWMREEEKNNPRILPEYKPSWLLLQSIAGLIAQY